MLTVCTYIWDDPKRGNRGYSFNADSVSHLHRMVYENLSVDFQFVCFAAPEIVRDLVHLRDEGVIVITMDMEKHVPGTVYARLIQHSPDFAKTYSSSCVAPITRVLSLDLDLVVVSSIDHIVNRPEDIVLWRNPNYGKPGRAFYQSSVQLFTPGARPDLYSLFDPATQRLPNGIPINWRFGGKEQAWISEILGWDEAYFSERDGIYGAGRLLTNGTGTILPDNACIVSFPGRRAPWQPEAQKDHPWLKEVYDDTIGQNGADPDRGV